VHYSLTNLLRTATAILKILESGPISFIAVTIGQSRGVTLLNLILAMPFLALSIIFLQQENSRLVLIQSL